MPRSLPFGRTVIVLLVLGFLALFAIGGASVYLAARVRQEPERLAVSDQVREAALQAYLSLREAEAGQRGFLVTDDLGYLQPFARGRVNALSHLNRLEKLTADDPAQQASVRKVRPLLDLKLAEMERGIALARAGDKDEAVTLVRTNEGRNYTLAIGLELRNVIVRETAELQGFQRTLRRMGEWLTTITLIGVALIAVLAVLSTTLVARALSELRSAGRELKRANEGLEGTVEARTQEIRRANEEIQRFAYIVSHDLRAPLVNVMGFTGELEGAGETFARQLAVVRDRAPELLDRDAVSAAEEDLPEAIGFIRASTAKMDRLIAAILRLSRDGRRVLLPQPVDMTALAEGVASSLRVMADHADAKIVVEPLPELVTDRLAMEQIFSNLVENAVKYLQPGRPGRIIISGRRRGSVSEFEVRDNGRGIDARDHARVFELFRRAGTQDRPGEGLGLAFVQAHVRRLGGSIELRSTAGEGSTFVLTFPNVLKLADAAAVVEREEAFA